MQDFHEYSNNIKEKILKLICGVIFAAFLQLDEIRLGILLTCQEDFH